MTRDIIVIGGGGHAKVCVELLQAMGEHVAYCVAGADGGERCAGIPVLRGDSHLIALREQGYSRIFIAIGSNRLRDRLATAALANGYYLANAISPHAVISPSAHIGHGVAIMAGAIVNAEARIDDLAIVNTGATIDHDCRIGKAVHVAPQCCLAGCVRVGDFSFLGVGVKVIPDIVIGNDTMIGAGAVVVGAIASGVRAVGVPARQIRSNEGRKKI